MKLIFLSTLLGLMAPVIASASPGIWTNEQVYEATKEACLITTAKDALGHTLEFDRLRAGIFRSAKFNQIIVTLQSDSFSQAMLDYRYRNETNTHSFIINNPGFEKALADCYPNNPLMIAFFKQAVHKADLRGKVVSGASTILLFASTSALLSGVGRIKKVLSHTLNFAGLAGIVTTIYRTYFESVETQKILSLACPDNQSAMNRQGCMKRNYMDSLAAVKNNATVEVETQRAAKALLISKAQNQIEEIEIRLKSSTSPSETKKLRDLINEREQFIAKQLNIE
ncbi:MAG: hypothetical protein JNM24_07465 [Bdellovibrionaceae bacterium]|nr:hypothetical protein [Pseudobdellovibrionaceae bacterium]